nr:ATP-dependent Clp protease proteolytic subunit [uncultured archaeon]
MQNIIEKFEIAGKSANINKKLISSSTNKLIDHSIKNLSPSVIEESSSGQLISYDVYSRLLKDRIIYFCHPVTTETSNIAIAQILFLEMTEGKKDITFYIMSPGGEIDSGSAILDTFELVSCDIKTVGMGVVASMGTMLLSSGTKGKRYALPSSRIMMHELASGFEGKMKDLKVSYEQCQIMEKRLYEKLSKNTGQDYETIFNKCQKDYWVSAEQAVGEGLIDEVLIKRK